MELIPWLASVRHAKASGLVTSGFFGFRPPTRRSQIPGSLSSLSSADIAQL